MGRLDNKVALITGGAMGMGLGSAQVLAKEGATVVILDISENGEASAEAIREAGGEAIAYEVDVREGLRLKEIAEEVFAIYGSIDILVNAAGIGSQRSFLESDDEYVDTYMAINFKGIWNAC